MFGQGSPVVDFRARSIFHIIRIVVSMVLLICCAHCVSNHPLAISCPLQQPTLLESGRAQVTAHSNDGETTSAGLNDTAEHGNSTLQELDPAVPDNTKKIRLRIYWGGGTPQRWSGKIRLKQGHFSNPQVLGVTEDAAASVLATAGVLQIKHWSATRFGGVDIDVSDSIGNQLELSLHDDGAIEQPAFHATVPVAEIFQEAYDQTLDDSGNRILIARVPGDELPVQISRPHLIFEPQEVFEFALGVNRTAWASQKASCRIRLQPLNSDESRPLAGIGVSKRNAISSNHASGQTVSFEMDAEGSARSQTVRMTLPSEEGVYVVNVELTAPWQQASFKPRDSVRRQIHVVVLSSRRPESAAPEPWRLVASIDPTVDSAPASKSRLSLGLRLNSNSNPLGNDQRRTVTIDEQPMLELGVGGWISVPLNFQQLDRPHRVEIEYLADRPSAVGLSLLEADANGQIPAYGFDSGLFVPHSLIEVQPKAANRNRQRHSFVVWPEKKSSHLLIVNRDNLKPATIGKVEVFAGPARLSSEAASQAISNDSISNNSAAKLAQFEVPSSRPADRRHFMVFSEDGLFAKNFGGPEAIDDSGNTYADWETYLRAADRLVQHLKSNDYSGAFLTVAVDGSTLYPSTVLGSSPRLDTGLLSRDGADPIRKDVLELLFRLFEREGLTLVPAVVLNGPLPAIEALRSQSAESSLPTRPVHWNGSTPELKLRDDFPIYNPLNSVVQSQVRQAIAELSARYRRFDCFAGIAIVCRPDTYAILPGQQWCCDVESLQQYGSSIQGDAAVLQDRDQLIQQILGPQQEGWLQWRAEMMTRWYQSLAQTLQQNCPGAKLFLAPVEIDRNEEMASVLSPNLHSNLDFAKQMLRLGWNVEQLASVKGMALLKPRRLAPIQSLADNRTDVSLENQLQSDAFFQRAGAVGDLYVHRISWAHFSQLEEAAEFQSQRSSIMRLQPLTPAGIWNRQRFLTGLRADDSQFLVDGGSLVPMGQESELRDFRKLFLQLPAARFIDVKQLDSITPNQTLFPVVVRQHLSDEGLWFYAANPSPWPCKVILKISDQASRPIRIRELSGERLAEISNENGTLIELMMEPISMTAGVIEQVQSIESFQFELSRQAADPLRKQVHMLQAKLLKSTNSQPLDVLNNSFFEIYDQPSLSGWDMGQQGTQGIALTTEKAFKGQACLRLKNVDQNPVWIRSNSFPMPQTGRLSISVWLRTPDSSQQPPLRISVEGVGSESSYYRFGTVGSLSIDAQANQLTDQWQRFAVHFDDLPINGLSQVRIGLDLMGNGVVDADQFEVYDRWFDEKDAKAINQRLASSGQLLANPMTYESGRILLGSYWLRFLDEHFRDQPILQTAGAGSGNAANKNSVRPVSGSATGFAASDASESESEAAEEEKAAANSAAKIEGNKVQGEGNKVQGEGNKVQGEGNKVQGEGNKDLNDRGLFRRLRRSNRIQR